MNFGLLSESEKAQKNRNIHNRDSYNQMLNSYQSLGSHLRTSHTMQRKQNYPCPTNSSQQGHLDCRSPNNTIQGTTNMMLSHQNYHNNSYQGLYHENNMVGGGTQPVVLLASSSNNNGSLMSATRYGGVSLSPLSKDHPFNTGSRDIPPSLRSHVGSVGNSSFNKNVGLKGYTNDFSNPSKTTFGNHNLPYNHFGTNNSLYPNNNRNRSSIFKDVNTRVSRNMKNSSMFKDFSPMSGHHLNNSSLFKDSTNHYLGVDMNSFKNVKGVNMPSCSLVSTQTQTLMNRSGSLARERAMKRPLCEVEGIHIIENASKVPRMSPTPPDEVKELLLFKDPEVPFFASEVMIEACEEDDENLDLSLHL